MIIEWMLFHLLWKVIAQKLCNCHALYPLYAAQIEITGNELGISDDLISLVIASPDVPDLTLIDLPGIARVAVDGQPVDIGEQVLSIIKSWSSPISFTTEPNTIQCQNDAPKSQ